MSRSCGGDRRYWNWIYDGGVKMINIYMIVFNIEGKLQRFFIHACNIEDAKKFASKKQEELKNEYGKQVLLKGIKVNKNDI